MPSDGLLPLLIAIALLRNLKNKKANVFGSSLKKYTYNNAVNKSGKLEGHSVHCISQVSPSNVNKGCMDDSHLIVLFNCVVLKTHCQDCICNSVEVKNKFKGLHPKPKI